MKHVKNSTEFMNERSENGKKITNVSLFDFDDYKESDIKKFIEKAFIERVRINKDLNKTKKEMQSWIDEIFDIYNNGEFEKNIKIGGGLLKYSKYKEGEE